MSSSLSIPDLGNRLPSETNIESSHNYVPVKSKLLRPPTGIPRHLTMHRGRRGGHLNVALEGWGI